MGLAEAAMGKITAIQANILDIVDVAFKGTIVGTGSKKIWVITHSLGTKEVKPTLLDPDFKECFTTIVPTSIDQVTVTFYNAPVLNKTYTIKINV